MSNEYKIIQVVDTTGRPVTGARVGFESLSQLSDQEGQCMFSIEDNMIGRHITITTLAPGYKPYSRHKVFSSRNGIEQIQLENETKNSSEPPIAIKVAKIGAIATVTAALITGMLMLFSKQFTTQHGNISVPSKPVKTYKSKPY